MDDDRIDRALRSGPPDEPAYQSIQITGAHRPSVRSSDPRAVGSLFAASAIAAAIIVGLLLVRPVVTTPTGPGSQDHLAGVRAAGRIRIAVTNGSPQVDVAGLGHEGFDLDVASAIGERLGLPVQLDLVESSEIERGGWADRWDLALDSQVSTTERGERLRVGSPYYTRSGAVFVPAGSAVRELSDLTGRRTCAVAGGIADGWLEGTLALVGGHAEPRPTDTIVTTRQTGEQCLAALRSGEVEAYVADWSFDVSAVPAGLTELPDAPFVGLVGPAMDPAGPDSDSLATEIDRIVAELRADGTLRALSERRFGGQDLTSLSLP